MKTRVGIFIEGLSLPAKEGIAKHSVELACFLAAQPDFEPILITVDRGRASLDALRGLPLDTLMVAESAYYDSLQVRRIIIDQKLDVVQNYNPHYFASILAPAARAVGASSVYELHDLEADLGFMNADADITKNNVRMQKCALAAATVSRIMSAYDFDAMKAKAAYRTEWIPVGIAGQAIRRQPVPGRVLFIGNASYPPNHESCRYIIDELAPRFPEKEFHLIGRNTDKLEGGDNVVVHGEVADLTPWLATAECGIAPTLRGSGMKIKLLTYLSAGMPCVATTVGAAGYPASPAIKVADSVEDFRIAFSQLASEEVVARYFEEHFDMRTLASKINNLYQKAATTSYTWPEVDAGKFDMSQLHWLKEGANKSFAPLTTNETYVRGLRPNVVVEGLPGAGKTSLIRHLKAELGNQAKFIDEIVADISSGSEDSYRNNDVLKAKMSKEIKAIGMSIMDRNYVSNLAFAYAKSKVTKDEKIFEEAQSWCIDALDKGELREPDLYIVLEVAPQNSIQRRSLASEHWGNLAFAQAVEEFYTGYFAQLPRQKVCRINGELPFADVTGQAQEYLSHTFEKQQELA